MGKESSGSLKQKDIDRLVQAQISANRIGQNTPTGSLDFSGGTANTTLSPQEQAILEQNQIARLLAGKQAEAQFGDIAGGRDAVEKASFDRAIALMGPELASRETQLRQRLANQGLPQSSNAFNAELGRFSDAQNRSLEQAALAATLAGGQEQSRTVANILSLLGLGQPAQPQFFNVPQVTIPVNQPQQGANPLMGALGGAAAGAPLGPWGIAGGAALGLLASQ